MHPAKRFFDLTFALLLAVILAPLIIGIAGLILLRDGRPILYISERMKTCDQPFRLWKFRTMAQLSQDSTVSGGHKRARITPLGRKLRRYRLDELPQLYNILRGDLSFVGPRPPLREYTESHRALYEQVLKFRPGVTGLATLMLHAREERLLANCRTAQETHAVYVRRCIPVKARLDLIWAKNWSICYDFNILLQTVLRVFYTGQRR